MLRRSVFPVQILTLFLTLLAYSDSDIPFWKRKTHVFKSIIEEREIVVSAKSVEEGGAKKFIVTSAGLIHAPRAFTYNRSIDFSQYGKILPYVNESGYNKTEKILWAKGTVLGFKAETKVRFGPLSLNKIPFEIVDGFLKSMKGEIVEESYEAFTLVSIVATYPGEVSMPSIIARWGFEFAAKKMASAMRKHIEQTWEESGELDPEGLVE